jgi:YCII-related domain
VPACRFDGSPFVGLLGAPQRERAADARYGVHATTDEGAKMSKFAFLYHGPATPPDAFTPEQSREMMRAWEEWMKRAGSALVDGGAPFGARTAVTDDGSTSSTTDQNGYSIVEAEDLEAAKALTKDHPFLTEGKGRFRIEIFELMPM